MLKTAEAVTPEHPDKLCDQISDAILDACLEQDPESRSAIEVIGGHDLIVVAGELTTKAKIDIPKIVKSVVKKDYEILVNIVRQSQEIARGVDNGGAGDQGIMIGYANDDNKSFLPQELYLAKSLCRFVYEKYPVDGKVQITIKEHKTKIIHSLVISFCSVSKKELEREIEVWKKINDIKKIGKIYINPAGDWFQGGFDADTGLTGRKLVCDNYGPQIPIGGGAFSGKDASKVDRSGAYMARKIAVDLLKKYRAKEVLVKIAYCIGRGEPVMANAIVISKKGSKRSLEISGYDLTPKGIIDFLKLKKPQFNQVAAWGSFGNGFKWDL